jgi:hypothetical protein
MEMRAKRDIRVRLKPCPWCKKTPDLSMPVGQDTWKWEIACRNSLCTMQPTSPHVSIRNTAKESIEKIAEKLALLAEKWNSGNDCVAFEYKIVDTGPIMSKYAEQVPSYKAHMDSYIEKVKRGVMNQPTAMPYRYF